MTSTQQAPIGRADTAPTAAQRVVSAMWMLGKPATAKAIAERAGVGYSTVSPILRNLLTDNQAVKTDGTTGQAEWQLTATLPTAPATATATTNDDTDTTDDGDGADEPDSPDPVSESGPDEPDGTDSGIEPAPDTGTDSDDGHSGSEPDEAPVPHDSDTAEQTTSRTYRKPVQPRRPKGELRAAVLAVLTGAPEQAFKVSEVCKAIDAANTDGSANKAGAGAVANALDKLVNTGDAVRIEDARVATYQSAPVGG